MKIFILLISLHSLLTAINLEHNVKEVTVSLNNITKIFNNVKRKNGNGLYVMNRNKIFYLQHPIEFKKTSIGKTTQLRFINGKKIKTTKEIQYYGVILQCLKTNDVYFNCTDF